MYKRQVIIRTATEQDFDAIWPIFHEIVAAGETYAYDPNTCLLYTSDAADERSSVDLGGRRIIQKKNSNVTNRR